MAGKYQRLPRSIWLGICTYSTGRASGRGQYYKELYGGGRARGRGRDGDGDNRPKRPRTAQNEVSGDVNKLVQVLRRLDGKSYPAYRDIEGSWQYPLGLLIVDFIQGDPFAPPSKFRLKIKQEDISYGRGLYDTSPRRVALCDYLTRHLYSVLRQSPPGIGSTSAGRGWHAAKGGNISIDKPGQQVLERSSVIVKDDAFEVRFTISLPAQGRTVLGLNAADIFEREIPRMFNAVLASSQPPEQVQRFVDCIDNQHHLRDEISQRGLVAFIPNGAILPRESGASDLPLSSPNVVAFQSPKGLEQVFKLKNSGEEIRGTGIPAGITMVAGGGFHGKSTLLDALANGCYNHIPGDGREYLVTSSKILSVEGEDGRSIKNVDISPFIKSLPGGANTSSFSTQDASGSTSMAAGIIEAVEMGADTLLLDEDTCATNFLIRDRRMQKLISSDPITPLIFKVRALRKDHTVSFVLVIGGCGDYCDVADLVLEMNHYQCRDITNAARKVAQEIPSVVSSYEETSFGEIRARVLDRSSLPTANAKVAVRRRAVIDLPNETLDLFTAGQLVHDSQTRAVGAALKHLRRIDASAPLNEVVAALDEEIDRHGLDAVVSSDRIDGMLARPRSFEITMAINRLRSAAISLAH